MPAPYAQVTALALLLASPIAMTTTLGSPTSGPMINSYLRKHYEVFRAERKPVDRLPLQGRGRVGTQSLAARHSRFLATVGRYSSYLVPLGRHSVCFVVVFSDTRRPFCAPARYFVAGNAGHLAQLPASKGRSLVHAVLPDGAREVWIRNAPGGRITDDPKIHVQPYRNFVARYLPGGTDREWLFHWTSRRGVEHNSGI
jgi:hypothetical protein